MTKKDQVAETYTFSLGHFVGSLPSGQVLQIDQSSGITQRYVKF